MRGAIGRRTPSSKRSSKVAVVADVPERRDQTERRRLVRFGHALGHRHRLAATAAVVAEGRERSGRPPSWSTHGAVAPPPEASPGMRSSRASSGHTAPANVPAVAVAPTSPPPRPETHAGSSPPHFRIGTPNAPSVTSSPAELAGDPHEQRLVDRLMAHPHQRGVRDLDTPRPGYLRRLPQLLPPLPVRVRALLVWPARSCEGPRPLGSSSAGCCPGHVVSASGDGGHVYRGVHEDLAALTCVAWRQDADLAGHLPGRRLGSCGERGWQRRGDRSRGWRQGRPYPPPTGPRDLRVLQPDRLSGSDWITDSTRSRSTSRLVQATLGCRGSEHGVSQGCALDQRLSAALVRGRRPLGLIPSRGSSLPTSRSSSSPMVR